jgi:hypothetical protein
MRKATPDELAFYYEQFSEIVKQNKVLLETGPSSGSKTFDSASNVPILNSGQVVQDGTDSASIDDLFEDNNAESTPDTSSSEPVKLPMPTERLALGKRVSDELEQSEAGTEAVNNGREEDMMEIDASPLDPPKASESEVESPPVAGQRPLGEDTSVRTASTSQNASIAGNSRAKQGQYSFRELIGQALLASNGTALTTAEVQDWIANTFPQIYRKGGPWKNNISPILSGTPDFQIQSKIGKQIFWSFKNAQARKKYERQFPEPRIPAPTLAAAPQNATLAATTVPSATRRPSRLSIVENMEIDEQHDASASALAEIRTFPESVADLRALLPEVSDEVRTRMQQAIDSLEQHKCEIVPGTHRSEDAHSSASAPVQTGSSSFVIVPKEPEHRDDDHLFNPFHTEESTNSYLPGDVRVETDFYEAFPEESYRMTEEQREKKIAAIRARPSRKATFGQVLATARYHRKDVHNELESEPRPSTALPKMTVVQRIEDDFWDISQVNEEVPREVQNLKEAFGLPQNLIPMLYEGQLAFREGTRVSRLYILRQLRKQS